MILIPQAFLLSADVSLTNARIGWQNYIRDFSLDASDVTVSSETDDGPKDGPLKPDTSGYWQPADMPATWLVDLGAPRDIDYVGIAAHTLGSDNCSVLVEYSTNGSSWTQFSDPAAPADDAPLMFLDGTKVVRYVRLTISAFDSPAPTPLIGVIYIGEVLAMQQPIYGGHGPINLSRNTVLKQAMSRGGVFLGQNYRRQGVQGEAAFRHLEPVWIRTDFDPFVRSARRFPYFFAWRPSTYPSEVVYGWTRKDIAPTNMGVKDLMQVSWPIEGIGHD